jgi:hypothetical protein
VSYLSALVGALEWFCKMRFGSADDAYPFSNFEESVLDRSGEVANPWNQLISNYNSKEFQ